jgi:vacuolar protein sorting-associated protein 13A/C
MALITIDTPQVVLAVDPLYALTDFATAPFKAKATGNNTLTQTDQSNGQDASATKEKGNPLSYRVEIRHSTILVLASDTEPSSQAIELRIKDIVVAQQVCSSISFLKPEDSAHFA